MPRVIVTCPDRRGQHGGFWSAGLHFGVGQTSIDVTDEQLKALRAEVERKESLLEVREPTAEELAAEEAAAKAAAKAAADAQAEAELEAEIRAEVEAKKGKGKR